jgi:hypothetical protein
MTPRPQLNLFTPKLTKFEDVDWLTVFKQPDFLTLGLCQRHVQIDDTGRDWFGMPFIEDADCARVQGSPYVAKLGPKEKELNKLLWNLEILAQRWDTPVSRANYRAHAESRQPGEKAYSEEAYFEMRLRQYVEAGAYPHPRIAAGIARQEGIGYPDFDAEGNSIPSPFEKFISLDYVSQVICSLEYCVQWKRQDIYYDQLVATEQAEQIREHAARQARSQERWAAIDADRERLRQLALASQQPAPEWVPAEQLDMFSQEVPSG